MKDAHTSSDRLAIRRYEPTDLHGVIECFRRSVHGLGVQQYSPQQLAVWAPERVDENAWRTRLGRGVTFVAGAGVHIAGFVTVEPPGHIDLLFVHPDHARQGLGRRLLQTACDWAADNGAIRLTADVSLVARPLFETLGFCVLRERSVERGGIALRNFCMERKLIVSQ